MKKHNLSNELVLLSQAEAAEMLCKKPRWLERKRWEGGGPPFQYIGRTPVYNQKELIKWVEALPKKNNTSIH